MKPIYGIPTSQHVDELQQKRIDEVLEFWDSGAEYAELTVYNPQTTTQTEKSHYERASRQCKLGFSRLNFCQRKGKIYVKRTKHNDHDDNPIEHDVQVITNMLRGMSMSQIKQIYKYIIQLKGEPRKEEELHGNGYPDAVGSSFPEGELLLQGQNTENPISKV